MEYESLFKAARQAGTLLAETETERLGRTLMHAAQLLRTHTPRLLEANARDLEAMAPDSPLRNSMAVDRDSIIPTFRSMMSWAWRSSSDCC